MAALTRVKQPQPTSSPPRQHPHRGMAVAVAPSVVVSALIVLRHLGTKPLWRDEAISVSVAGRPVERILSVLPRHDANAGLYYVILHAWLRVDQSPAWARGLSAACFIATAGLAAWAGSRWRGPELGLACGVLVAVNPFLLYYGQEARPYALAVLLAAAATIALLWRVGPHGVEPAPRAFMAASIALAYVNLFAVLYIAALVGAVAVVHWRRHHPLPAGLVRCSVVIAAAAAPLAVVMVFFERGQISWLPRPGPGVLARTMTTMGGGGAGLALALALAAAAVALATRADRVVAVVLAAAFALPPLALWAAAQVVPVFIDRYVICSALAMIGLAAAGLSVVRERLARAGRLAALAVLAGLLLLGGQQTAKLEAEPFKVDDAPTIIRYVESRARPGDAVAYAGGGLRTLIEASLPQPGDPFPLDVALAPGGQAFLQNDLYAREVTATELATRLQAVERLWLLTDPLDQGYPQGGPFGALWPAVASTFGPAAAVSFGSVDVTLLTRRR